jgi:outer membrane lipoprotein-sorting protein
MPRRAHHGLLALACLASLTVIAGCAARRVSLPSGPGEPFADARTAYEQAVKECRNVRTIRATLGLSGRAGATTLRGNVDAGFEAPDRIRLEGRHPLGRPVFILVSSGPQTTLYMPRENRVLQHASAADIVEALVGLKLTPDDLRTLVGGCGFEVGEPTDGRRYGDLAAVTVSGTTSYLRQQQGQWRVVGATAATAPGAAGAAAAPLGIFYSAFASGRPTMVRLRAEGATPADVTVRLSDVNINVTLEPDVFAIDVPVQAEPLTIEELRRAGPLGGA